MATDTSDEPRLLAPWVRDSWSLALTYVAALILGIGVYKFLVPVAVLLAGAAILVRWRQFRFDRWRIGFLILTLAAYGWYRFAFILPAAMPDGAQPISLDLFAVVVLYSVLAFLLAATAGRQAAAIRVVILISVGMLAKATMLLAGVAIVAQLPPPYYNVGGFDPIVGSFLNPNNVNDIAVYSMWTLVAFLAFRPSQFSRVGLIAGSLLLWWSLMVGSAFSGRTFLAITAVALAGMMIRYLRSWRAVGVLLVFVVALVVLHFVAAAAIEFYRAGFDTLVQRVAIEGLNSSRVGLYQSWLSQFVADPFARPVVDDDAFSVYWFHDMWMDAHRTSGLLAPILLLAMWAVPWVRLFRPLTGGDMTAWSAFVALGCTTLLVSLSVPIEGGNFAGLAYFSALAALIFRIADDFDAATRATR